MKRNHVDAYMCDNLNARSNLISDTNSTNDLLLIMTFLYLNLMVAYATDALF